MTLSSRLNNEMIGHETVVLQSVTVKTVLEATSVYLPSAFKGQ